MENQNPIADSSLPIPQPPKPVLWSTVISTTIIACFMVWCISNDNWLGASLDAGLIALNVGFAIIRYRSLSSLYRQCRNLHVLRRIIDTPTMREEGNSIIFTYIAPSDRIMEELKRINDSFNKKN